MNWLTWVGLLLAGLSFLFDKELSGAEAGDEAGVVGVDATGSGVGVASDGSTLTTAGTGTSYTGAVSGLLGTTVQTLGDVATSWGPVGTLGAAAIVTEGPSGLMDRVTAWVKKYWWILLIIGVGVVWYLNRPQTVVAAN